MQANEIRSRFLKFFEARGHKIIPSASLVPLNDPSTLFTSSGMQPMVPYLLGQPYPLGNRITDSQKCFRTVDIDEVGDNRHTTFFEMLGNWSLGDYFKKEQISWVFEFLVDDIGLDPNKLYVTAFIGDGKNNIPKDPESVGIWKNLFKKKGIEAKEVDIGSEENGYKVGMQDGRIFYYDAKKNWWSRAGVPEDMPVGEPGGPDSEVFYEFTYVKHDPKFGKHCHPNCDCGRFLEIGNSVFMEYKKNEDGTFSKLPKQNVDFGGGLERIAMAVNDSHDIIKTNHKYILDYLEKMSGKAYGENDEEMRAFRIVSDHMKAAVFLIGDGVNPSNTERGYFVRRLIRRAVLFCDKLGIQKNSLAGVTNAIVSTYQNEYPDTYKKRETIEAEILQEEVKFRETLVQGVKEFEKGRDAFTLFTTYGFPLELTLELAREKGIAIDLEDFKKKLAGHKELSQTASAGMFRGGLANTSDETVKLHTAHHLLLAALQKVVGKSVKQRGSNINEERLRMDFVCDHKLTEEEKSKVEELVNEHIAAGLPVTRREMPLPEAEKIGAEMEFGAKYPEIVSVYFIGVAPQGRTLGAKKGSTLGSSLESRGGYVSVEFCGGPHVGNTAELGRGKDGSPRRFQILKEESVAQGIRRIKAALR